MVSVSVELAVLLANAAPTAVASKSVLARKVKPAMVTDWPAFSGLKVTAAVSVADPVPCVTVMEGDCGMMAPATPGMTWLGAALNVSTLPLLVVVAAVSVPV